MSGVIHSRHHGFGLVFFVVLLFVVGAVVLFTRFNSAPLRAIAQDEQNQTNLTRIRDGLVNFVSVNGYLPCPADGTLATGVAAPPAASVTCTFSTGVVPWATLGLSSNDVTDPFQNKISYRVYSGATGLTQAGGATMANCDSIRAAPPVPQTIGVDTLTGLCRVDHNTSPAQFLAVAGKGLSVTDAGTAVTSVAFVLISHGKNGSGAYRTDGGRNALPNVASAEYGQTQATGPFVIKPANTAELAQTDTNYFDDTLTYLSISDLAGRAKVTARDWPDPIASETFTAAGVAAALAAAGGTFSGTSTNTSSLTVDGIGITSTGGSGRYISSVTGTSGYGIGVINIGQTSGGTISGSDVLTLVFGAAGQKLGLMLVDFGSSSGQVERAQLVFKYGSTTVLTTTVTSCRAGSQLASYSIDVGALFDRVELSALSRVGSGSSSNFLLGEIAECPAAASICTTANATVSTACAYP